ncbi:hypothetical protein H181DRAFT_01116 [Streptomyces sp. WMMB 714]|uniref:hypothetical protein n=1 Tax=Streptomyces sp. WMMB 714 TaxID=1286822 RepID=UPI0005F80922|nr:hypothetical protein [Streptomyces sp. WMMB 714]SCK16975.1 hypothetical protein H181DRAFT_01116 [Streptomyces sp. WMMB 714]
MALSEATSQQTPRTQLPPLDVQQAEAALVEHYPRLVRLAYLVLPPSLARQRRVLAAHSLVQRALPRSREAAASGPLPPQRGSARRESAGDGAGGRAGEVYLWLAARMLRGALAGERRRLGPLSRLPRRPGLLPQVFGLKLVPRSGGAGELALDEALSDVSGAARAAYALRGLEGLADGEIRTVLEEAGVPDPAAALREAGTVQAPAGGEDRPLLSSPEFDPCLLQARPTDLARRRQHGRAALVAAVALAVCGALLGLPGGAWGPDGAAAPPYARNPAAEKALDPGALVRVPAGAWKKASRTDFSVWPTRGELTSNQALLRRALAVWARPGPQVKVSVTRGTSSGPPSGPPHLLYAGRLDGAQVVLLHDGLRIARYAEPEGAEEGGAVLDLARTDGADMASAAALVVSRSDSNVRYLTAPWVTEAAEADLLRPDDSGRTLRREHDGVLASLTAPRASGDCSRWPGLVLTSETASGGTKKRLYTDLGELAAVRLTYGSPRRKAREAMGERARTRLAHTSCAMRALVGSGTRSVNTWRFKQQLLPEGEGIASWTCTRAETWRGQGAQALGGFQPPAEEPDEPAVLTARAMDTTSCGKREPNVVSATRWRSQAGNWYVLAAGSSKVTGITVKGRGEGSPSGFSTDRTLTLPGTKRARVKLTARLADGGKLPALRSTRPARR